jgi:hypothetical protein
VVDDVLGVLLLQAVTRDSRAMGMASATGFIARLWRTILG